MIVMLSCCDCFFVLLCAMLQNINLFMEMNEEEFAKFLQTFVTDVWGLLMKVSMNPGQVCWAVGDRRLFVGRQLLVITRLQHCHLLRCARLPCGFDRTRRTTW